ncbi:hypothetical protein UlMin_012485 [Ulmus minor]
MKVTILRFWADPLVLGSFFTPPSVVLTTTLSISPSLSIDPSGTFFFKYFSNCPFLIMALSYAYKFLHVARVCPRKLVVMVETKGFLGVTDQKDGYTFVYPFRWQEIVIEGQDKVLKDVIEPLENFSINFFPKNKQDIGEFGPPQEVAETLIKKVLAPTNQKKRYFPYFNFYYNHLFFFKFEARNLFLRILLIYTIDGNYCRKEKMPKILKHALESLLMKSES